MQEGRGEKRVKPKDQPFISFTKQSCVSRFALLLCQAITTGGVTYREQPWHKDCFLCTSCKQQLSGQRFTSRDDFAYCLNCFCNLYAKKCASCTTPISGRPKYITDYCITRIFLGNFISNTFSKRHP